MTAMLVETNLAREGIYRFLAEMLVDPRAGQAPAAAVSPELAAWLNEAADLLRTGVSTSAADLGFGEVAVERLRFSVLCTLANDLDAQERRWEYERVFGLMSCRECPPFETEFSPNEEPFYRAQQLADIAGFYRAFGLNVPAQQSQRADHVSIQLAFMAHLLMKERLAPEAAAGLVCQDAARDFFAEHLAWWIPSFTRGLRAKAGEGWYAELANVLAAFITSERQRYGLPAPTVPMVPRPDAVEAEAQPDCGACAARLA